MNEVQVRATEVMAEHLQQLRESANIKTPVSKEVFNKTAINLDSEGFLHLDGDTEIALETMLGATLVVVQTGYDFLVSTWREWSLLPADGDCASLQALGDECITKHETNPKAIATHVSEDFGRSYPYVCALRSAGILRNRTLGSN